jgi:hypothetical protein
MLNVASEPAPASHAIACARNWRAWAQSSGESVSYDYSALAMTATRANFDRSWDIFTDVALHPAFT